METKFIEYCDYNHNINNTCIKYNHNSNVNDNINDNIDYDYITIKNKYILPTISEIYNLSNKYTKPILFKNLLKNTFAVNNWSKEYFINNFGDYIIPYSKGKQWYEKRKQYNIKNNCDNDYLLGISTLNKYFNKNMSNVDYNDPNRSDPCLVVFWALNDKDYKLNKLLNDSGIYNQLKTIKDIYIAAGIFMGDLTNYNISNTSYGSYTR